MSLINPEESPLTPPPRSNGDSVLFNVVEHESDVDADDTGYHPDLFEVRISLTCGQVKRFFMEERGKVDEVRETFKESIVTDTPFVLDFPGKAQFQATIIMEDGSSKIIQTFRDITVSIPTTHITSIEIDLGESARDMELVTNESGDLFARYKFDDLELE